MPSTTGRVPTGPTIFNGLAISLIFGIFVSTLLTLVVLPSLYVAWFSPKSGGTDGHKPS